MTVAQRQSIYGDSPNAPQRTSNNSQSHAEAKQRQLAREKEHQDALNSDTVAIEFAGQGSRAQQPTAMLTERQQGSVQAAGEDPPSAGQGSATPRAAAVQTVAELRTPAKADAMAAYPFDSYQGRLYRVFEGTVLEGVVTNHIHGGFNGPILVTELQR